jgi:Asp-tRNA(Asn)/Glu-tRNA(Gln) amidotransferase A subunit family amidase
VKIKLLGLLTIVSLSIVAASAQSGRIQTAPTEPGDKPTVQLTQDPAEIKRQDAITYSDSVPPVRRLLLPRAWTLLHVPCLNVPGATGFNGLPMGVQVIAPVREDALCLRAGRVLEQALAQPR